MANYIKIFLIITMFSSIKCRYCNEQSAAIALKRPVYDFSIRILDMIDQETQGHFVFSPVSTWLQLVSLAEGANGMTQKEIWKITRHHKQLCFRRKIRFMLNKMEKEFKDNASKRSVIIIDKLLNMKKTFKNEVEKLNSVKVKAMDFNNPEQSAAIANNLIKDKYIDEPVLYPDDFNYSSLIMAEGAHLKCTWKYPFNPTHTKVETFYSETKNSNGEVNMMSQGGYFNVTELPLLKVKVLELPVGKDRLSMLIFLTTSSTKSIRDIFYNMKQIRLAAIYNKFAKDGLRLVSVKVPKFKITTVIENLPELINDMGARRMFYPGVADFKGISDFKIHVSIMSHVAEIEVNEEGVEGSSLVENLIVGKPIEFKANRPFAFMLVDRITGLIYFAGVYSSPSVYK